jgi:TolB protein
MSPIYPLLNNLEERLLEEAFLMQIFYTVRTGDSIQVIASRRGVPISSLIASNRISPPYTIFPGQQLSMPPGVDKIRIKQGDTLYSISQFYGIPINYLISINHLQSPYQITVGQVLTIPLGVPYYVVRPGDTLYQIGLRYHVTTNGQSRADLIQLVNNLPSDNLTPGMQLRIPYAPIGEEGWIAYTTNRGGTYDIWLYLSTDGSTLPLTKGLGTETSTPNWSPDCRKIAFVGIEGILFVIAVISGTVSRIDQVEPTILLDWSPDSQFLAYVKGDDQIVIYNTASHSSHIIQQPGASDPQWFPSGQDLLYAAPDASGLTQLYKIARDGSNKSQITQNTNGPLHNVRLSPNGTFVLFTSPGASISLITTVHLATGKTFSLKGGPLSKNYYPEWSPDSNAIAYSATFYPHSGYYSFIQTDRSTGGQIRTWAISDCFGSQVSWSPNGNYIAYLSGCDNEGKTNQVWVVDAQDPVPILILQGGHITAVQWSPTVEIEPPQTAFISPEYHVSFLYPAYWNK